MDSSDENDAWLDIVNFRDSQSVRFENVDCTQMKGSPVVNRKKLPKANVPQKVRKRTAECPLCGYQCSSNGKNHRLGMQFINHLGQHKSSFDPSIYKTCCYCLSSLSGTNLNKCCKQELLRCSNSADVLDMSDYSCSVKRYLAIVNRAKIIASDRVAQYDAQFNNDLVSLSIGNDERNSIISSEVELIHQDLNNDKSSSLDISSSEDSSEDEICCETLNAANALVADLFDDVKKLTELEVTGPELNNFCKTVEHLRRGSKVRVYRTADGSVAAMPIVKADTSVASNKQVVVFDQNGNSVSVYAKVVRTCNGVEPRLRYFSHSEEIIYTPDTLRLSHIPYIDDNTCDDAMFLEELRHVYPEGIHGTSRGCEEHISDFMMWKLLGATLRNWAKDRSYIFRAISEKFPNKYSYQQLKSKETRLTLKERFEGNSVDTTQMKGDASITGVTSLLCSKCLIYNCLMHQVVPVIPPPSVFPVFLPKRGHNRCGKECFLSSSIHDKYAVQNLDSNFLMDFFRARVSRREYDLCEVAENMNRMCVSMHMPTLQCREWYSLVRGWQNDQSTSELVVGVPLTANKGNKQKQRERYKLFTHSLKKRNINGVDNIICNVMPTPCNHSRKNCEEGNCPCFDNGGVCTKYCRCVTDCRIKFPGCTCSAGRCFASSCACFLANWECDPDTCLSCNCDAVHSIESKSGEVVKLCRNIGVQLKLQKQLKIGVSTIPNAGNGCFLIGSAAPGDLISEYTGELISHEEAERRGRIYDKLKCSYIFKLSGEKSLDSARIGNLIRFANNDSKNPNCLAKTIVVNGEHRIAVYAKKHINDGEELLFDYQYREEHRAFKEPSRGKNKLENTAFTSTFG